MHTKKVILSMLLLFSIITSIITYTYWSNALESEITSYYSITTTGHWASDVSGILIVPEADSNINIDSGTYFIYNGVLYITKTNYNPLYHGEAGTTGNNWAWAPTTLEWNSNAAYNIANTVVEYNNHYYISNFYSVNKQPDIYHSSRNAGQPWTEIAQVDNIIFLYNEFVGIYDYTSPNMNLIILLE